MDSSDNIPLKIMQIPYGDKTFNLIQDTYLPAGTKQRGIEYFRKLKEQGYTEITTHGSTHGYGQTATSWCCKEVGLACTIFLAKIRSQTKMTKEAIKFGANVIEIGNEDGYPTNKVLSLKAQQYASKNENIKLLELGLDDPDFIQEMANNIIANKGNINPKRIWCVVGSAVLVRALHKAFPETEFCIVQVGRKIYPDILEGINYKLYISPEPFKQNAEILPPYRSLYHYDAKLWRYVIEEGQSGDYIWNVK